MPATARLQATAVRTSSKARAARSPDASELMLKDRRIAQIRGREQLAFAAVGERREIRERADSDPDSERRMQDRHERPNRRFQRVWHAVLALQYVASLVFRYLCGLKNDMVTAGACQPQRIPRFLDAPSVGRQDEPPGRGAPPAMTGSPSSNTTQ
jgi:hypothetical protein